MFSPRKNGIVLGRYLKETDWRVYNTFVTNEMKFAEQNEREQQLIENWEGEANLEFLLNENSSHYKGLKSFLMELQNKRLEQ